MQVFRLTHEVQVIECLMHSDHFVVQFIVTCRRGQKCVPVGDEQVENVDDLKIERIL
jgi:hypothetical protein